MAKELHTRTQTDGGKFYKAEPCIKALSPLHRKEAYNNRAPRRRGRLGALDSFFYKFTANTLPPPLGDDKEVNDDKYKCAVTDQADHSYRADAANRGKDKQGRADGALHQFRLQFRHTAGIAQASEYIWSEDSFTDKNIVHAANTSYKSRRIFCASAVSYKYPYTHRPYRK